MLNKGLNGINDWTNRNIALGLTGKLSLYFKDGPARLCMIVLKPVWELSGLRRLFRAYPFPFRAVLFRPCTAAGTLYPAGY